MLSYAMRQINQSGAKMPEIEKYSGDIEYLNSGDLFADTKTIILSAQKATCKSVNSFLVLRNWLLGRRIAEDELAGSKAEYGAETITKLSKHLVDVFGSGKGLGRKDLYSYLSFYKAFPAIVDTLCRQLPILSWSHYRALLRIHDGNARTWYEQEALSENWSVRTLQRNVSSQYYYRILRSQAKEPVIEEMHELAELPQRDQLEFIKNPTILEFLNFPESATASLRESTLEQAILSNLEKFLLELGKGYAFVARQKHIHTEKEDYFIDLVFYNYYLKCFVLIDLKTSKIRHQDVGQMDMYVRMYDELVRSDNDGPTIGIVLCADTDDDIARYSVLHGNDQLFASKYVLYLPSEEELREEIENQKTMFYLQYGDRDQ